MEDANTNGIQNEIQFEMALNMDSRWEWKKEIDTVRNSGKWLDTDASTKKQH